MGRPQWPTAVPTFRRQRCRAARFANSTHHFLGVFLTHFLRHNDSSDFIAQSLDEDFVNTPQNTPQASALFT
jgi:hypothetical protein